MDGSWGRKARGTLSSPIDALCPSPRENATPSEKSLPQDASIAAPAMGFGALLIGFSVEKWHPLVRMPHLPRPCPPSEILDSPLTEVFIFSTMYQGSGCFLNLRQFYHQGS